MMATGKDFEVIYSLADSADLGFIRQVLVDCKLPAQDLITTPIDFIVAELDHHVIGCIGIELYRSEGFLRSFAIQDQMRNQGIGDILFNHLVEYAKSKNVQSMHLLTTTAEAFFNKRGFIQTDRKNAPRSIQETTEFKGMCCSTAVYMQKYLTDKVPDKVL